MPHASVSNIPGSCGSCGCGNSHPSSSSGWKKYVPALLSLVLLVTGLITDYLLNFHFFSGPVRVVWYGIAYLTVGFPVLREAWEAMRRHNFFNEFTLMVVATLGAFLIGEYPEGVAVMLFYSVGELFQGAAVSKARGHIQALLDLRPETATVRRKNGFISVSPESVVVGETIQVKAGEKIPLDGELLTASGTLNTAALTGESVPRTLHRGETVLAGMLNLDQVLEIRVTRNYADSSLSKILELVQHATSRKAPTELLIRKFAKVYTPVVFLLASLLVVLPAFFIPEYVFSDWLYRGLVFLVISCPCALVVSIPLSYFGGIGAASRHGILFKGANYLERMTQVNTVVLDKTGTLTEGVFQVREALPAQPADRQWLLHAAAIESHSTHPIAKAISSYFPATELPVHSHIQIKEIAGKGMIGQLAGEEILVGNPSLMKEHHIAYPDILHTLPETVVIVSASGVYRGYFIVADRLKEDAAQAIRSLRKEGIRHTILLSGDHAGIVHKVATELEITEAHGNLLPQDKVAQLELLKADPSRVVAFVGDGINDAPVLALSDIGIAMGGMGTDLAIEVADVVIQTDQPSKIATALRIAKTTRHIVIQNILLALGIKVAVLLLGALGIATMWEAVFADVGVSLLAILNAIRILRKKF